MLGRILKGRMTITESRPNERIRIQLDFLKPMAGTNTAEFRGFSLERVLADADKVLTRARK